MPKSATSKVEIINGLRGFAILAVIFHHIPGPDYRSFIYLTDSGYLLNPLTFLANGWLGVNLFFILSGFVLFLPYMEGKREISSLSGILAFFLHRASRLLPLYYFSVFFAIFILYRSVDDPVFIKNLLLMLTITFNFTREAWHPIYNPVLWSIGIEVWFSLLFPFLIILVNRFGLGKLFILILALSLGVRFFGVIYPYFELANSSLYFNAMKDSVLGRLDDFLLGMLICYIYVKRIREKGLRAPWFFFLLGLVFLLIVCILWDFWTHGFLSYRYLPLLNNITQAAFFFILIALLSLKGGLLRAVFVFKPLQVAGLMCYSLYIWHYMAVKTLMVNTFSIGGLVLFIAVLISASALTYRFIEFPGRKTRSLFLIPEKRQ